MRRSLGVGQALFVSGAPTDLWRRCLALSGGLGSVQEVALPNGAPNDVDREFVLAYSIQDEVKSFYFPQNLAQLGAGLSNAQQTALTADDDGAANEQFHSINGALSPPFCGRPVPKRAAGAS